MTSGVLIAAGFLCIGAAFWILSVGESDRDDDVPPLIHPQDRRLWHIATLGWQWASLGIALSGGLMLILGGTTRLEAHTGGMVTVLLGTYSVAMLTWIGVLLRCTNSLRQTLSNGRLWWTLMVITLTRWSVSAA